MLFIIQNFWKIVVMLGKFELVTKKIGLTNNVLSIIFFDMAIRKIDSDTRIIINFQKNLSVTFIILR